MSGLSWHNAKVANGPRLVRWLDEQGIPIRGNLRHAWAAGSQASLGAVDRILTRNGAHLWMVPDDVWEAPRKRGGRPRDEQTRRRVLDAYRRLGNKRQAAEVAGVPVSTARYIINRAQERTAA